MLPFSVRGPELEAWREGMVDLLSTGLDGAAGLRTINSRTVLARWKELVPDPDKADLTVALRVARATGARHAVLGSVVALGSEVRVVVDIYDVETEQRVGQAQVESTPDSVLALVDRVSVEVLRVILQAGEGALPRVDLASVTTTSVPPLEAFLEGEVHHRRADFKAAIAAYTRAVEADSTFALACFQLAQAHGWAETFASELSRQALERATRWREKLPPRKATLLTAYRAFQSFSMEAVDSLRDAVLRYPDDPEVWYRLGDTYYHLRYLAAVSLEDVRDAFRRAAALDPEFAPYRIHLIDIAFQLAADSADVARVVEEYGGLAPGTRYDREARLAFGLAYGDEATRAKTRAALDTLHPDTLARLSRLLFHPRFADAMEAVYLAARRRDPDAAWATSELAILEWMLRGRVKAALSLLEQVPRAARPCILYQMAVRGLPVPQQRLEGEFGITTIDSTTPPGILLCHGGHAADRGNWELHGRLVTELRRRAEHAQSRGDSLLARRQDALARTLEAIGLWRRGQPRAALPALLAAYREAGGAAQEFMWALGMLHRELGQLQEAERYLRALSLDPLAHYHLGKIYEELGEREKARKSCELFVNAWKDADPELQPLVQETRERLARLESTAGP
ncbi:MAG: tetratricopeptide repeat protein [Gemmatimonadetes bacterium]|nr:tetratricopeptide repeat protein [Gemmatimonadota bacterium]